MRTDEVSQGAWIDSCSESLIAAKVESPWPGHHTVHLRQNEVLADAPRVSRHGKSTASSAFSWGALPQKIPEPSESLRAEVWGLLVYECGLDQEQRRCSHTQWVPRASPLPSHSKGKDLIFLFVLGNPCPYKLRWKMAASPLV